MTKLIDQFGDTHIINDGKDGEVKGIIMAKARRGSVYAAKYLWNKTWEQIQKAKNEECYKDINRKDCS